MVRQASLSMEFSRQGYWNRFPFPPPGNLPDPGIECVSLAFPALAGRFFFLPLSHWGIRQLSLGFVYSSFSCSLKYLWVILFFLIQVFHTTNVPLSTAFAASHKFCYVIFFGCLKVFFNFPFDCFLYSLIFKNVLFNFHIFVNFPFFLLLISSYILLWLEKIPGMISNFLNL